MDSPDHSRLILSRNKGDRALLFLFTPFIMLLTGFAALFAHYWEPPEIGQRIIKFVAFEIAFTFFCLATLCFIWAIAAPRWLEQLMQKAYHKTMITIGFLAIGGCIFIASLFFGYH